MKKYRSSKSLSLQTAVSFCPLLNSIFIKHAYFLFHHSTILIYNTQAGNSKTDNYHIVHMHHKALTIQTRSLDQRLLAAVITIEIAFGNISNIITFPVTNPIDVFRRAFRLDILLFNQDSYPAYNFICSTTYIYLLMLTYLSTYWRSKTHQNNKN